MVIRARILASWANISKRKGVSSPGPEGFFRTWLNRTSFGFSFPLVGTEADAGTCTDVVCCCVSSVAFSYYFKYDFSDRVLLAEVHQPASCKRAFPLQNR